MFKVKLRQCVLNTTLPFKSVITVSGLFIKCVASCNDFANCIDIKECDAPGSNKTLARVFEIKIYLELSHGLGAGSQLAHTLCPGDSRVADCLPDFVRRG